MGWQCSGKSLRLAVVIRKDHVFAKLDARLHNHANHTLPRLRQFLFIKGGAEDFQRAMQLPDRGDARWLSLKGLPARRWNLGADYVEESRGSRRQLQVRAFRGATEDGGSLGNRVVCETRSGIVSARHAGVEMNLFISRKHTGTNQITRLPQSDFGRLIAPRIRPKMVSAQQHALPAESRILSGGVNKLRELFRRSSRVTTELIHLARCGLDKQN